LKVDVVEARDNPDFCDVKDAVGTSDASGGISYSSASGTVDSKNKECKKTLEFRPAASLFMLSKPDVETSAY
jgi:hypothetical protein